MLNYFHLFHVPECFEVDQEVLQQVYERLQRQYHPDRHVQAAPEEQLRMATMAAEVNMAWKTLTSPLLRAEHLLRLHGVDLQQRVVLSPAFLMEQIDWREQLEQADHLFKLNELQRLFSERLRTEANAFQASLEADRLELARHHFTSMQFFQRLRDEANHRIDILEFEE